MFEAITDNDNRGQVGIGTLIVFIAMVLVAAIAAGVLINTAGVLQSQASDTGSETQEAVANQIEVVHASGNVTGDHVDVLNLTIMKSAGSNAIDLTAMTVQYSSSRTDKTLVHDSGSGTVDGGDAFGTENVAGDDGDANSLISTDDRVKLTVNASAVEDNGGLKGGSSATLALVDQSGAEFTYGVSIPSTFGNKEVVKV